MQVNLQAFVTPTTILTVNALTTDSTFDTEAPSAATAYGSNALAGAAGYTYANGSMSLEPHNPTQAVSFQTVTRAQAALITLVQLASWIICCYIRFCRWCW